MLLRTREVQAGELEARTGWRIEDRGACRGEVCVPLPDAVRLPGGALDPDVLADRLGMPLVDDEEHGLRALGPATVPAGRALTSAEAPEVVLPDHRGDELRLSTLRGTKVLLVAWASW